MSTFMANKANIERKWYVLDAAGKPLGKTAAAAALFALMFLPFPVPLVESCCRRYITLHEKG